GPRCTGWQYSLGRGPCVTSPAPAAAISTNPPGHSSNRAWPEPTHHCCPTKHWKIITGSPLAQICNPAHIPSDRPREPHLPIRAARTPPLIHGWADWDAPRTSAGRWRDSTKTPHDRTTAPVGPSLGPQILRSVREFRRHRRREPVCFSESWRHFEHELHASASVLSPLEALLP